jgi:hypothetical protein
MPANIQRKIITRVRICVAPRFKVVVVTISKQAGTAIKSQSGFENASQRGDRM